jgi:hypothetical protein
MSEELLEYEDAPITRKKSKFSMNQIVIFRFGSRNLVGKVIDVRPINKKIGYLLLGEDGKQYGHMLVDTGHAECIDTRLTKIFYTQYNMDINAIPEHIEEAAAISIKAPKAPEPEEIEQEEESDVLFDFDDAIPFDEDDM